MRELSVAEQRYQAVLAVISDGLCISQAAQKVGVSRQTLHSWLARYEAEGLEGLSDRSHRPAWCRAWRQTTPTMTDDLTQNRARHASRTRSVDDGLEL
jgi:transposase